MQGESRYDIVGLLGAVGAVVWEYDWPTGRFTSVSEGCERLLGFSATEWMRPGFWLERLHPEDRDAAVAYCRASTEQGLDHAFEYRMIHADGRSVWVRDTVLVDPTLRIDGRLQGLFLDITDTMRNAEQLQAVFRLMRDLFFRLDGTGAIIGYAAAEDQRLYLPPSAFLGKRLVDVLPAEAAVLLRACIDEAHETGRMALTEYVLATDGESMEWEGRILPLADGETAVICRDITERKLQHREIARQQQRLQTAFAELTVSEERFRNLVDRAPVGVQMYALTTGRLVLARANAAADTLIGVTHEHLLGEPIESAPALAAHVDRLYAIALTGGDLHVEVTVESRQTTRVLDVTAFQTSTGQLAVMLFDITHRKEMEAAERQHNERVSALAAQIASAEDIERRRLAEELHDRVSQPLAVARMRLTAGMQSCADRPVAEAEIALEMLEKAIAETRAITTELYPPVLRELGLAAALEWLCDEYCTTHGLCAEPSFDDVHELLPEEVQAALFRAARELLMNVVKHAETDTVWVSLDLLGDRVALTVADEGRGFDISGAMQRSQAAGFGLFSVAERMRYLGGTCEIEGGVGEGVRVTVSVPIAR